MVDPTLPRKLLTLAFVVRNHVAKHTTTKQLNRPFEVLLGEKKRGFGKGKWNGFGGKVEATDATIAVAAAREIEEEAHVHVHPHDLSPRGILTFSFEGGREILEVHVFLTTKFRGEPSESDEMRPQWYQSDQLPFDQMWADDRLWLPHVLNDQVVNGHFHFAADENTLLHHDMQISPSTEQ